MNPRVPKQPIQRTEATRFIKEPSRSAGTRRWHFPAGTKASNIYSKEIFSVLAILTVSIGLAASYKAVKKLHHEIKFRETYGPDWQSKYEQFYGSVAHAHAQIAG